MQFPWEHSRESFLQMTVERIKQLKSGYGIGDGPLFSPMKAAQWSMKLKKAWLPECINTQIFCDGGPVKQ